MHYLNRIVLRTLLASALLFAGANLRAAEPATIAGAGDWAQWRGPNRDGISPETGLLHAWPEGGPKLVFSVNGLGEGYSSLAIVGDRIYTQGTDGDKSVVICLNRADGAPVWKTPTGPRLDQDQGPGPRGAPTLEGDDLWALNENGDLVRINAADGKIVWQKSLTADFNAANPNWHFAESPLIDGDHLIICPGGKKAGVVALNKQSGRQLWATQDLSENAAYSSAILQTIGGIPTIMNFTSEAAVGVAADDGRLLWKEKSPANNTANCTTAVYRDGKVFFSSAYNTGGAQFALTANGKDMTAKETYFVKEMDNHHGGIVLVGDAMYGFGGNVLACVDWNTGQVLWRDRSVGKGAVIYADGDLYLLSEANTVGLAKASPEGYVETGRFRIEDKGRSSWAHPVIAGKKLFIRNQDSLMCYDIAGQ